jgi:Fe-S cluster biogenesis protein NfuA
MLHITEHSQRQSPWIHGRKTVLIFALKSPATPPANICIASFSTIRKKTQTLKRPLNLSSISDPSQRPRHALSGATVDWLEGVNGSGFKVENPNKPTNNLDSQIARDIQKLLDNEQVNTAVSAHGGNIELLDVIEDRAYVKMGGGCQGCSSAAATLKQGVETRIKAAFPEIKHVIDSTDHASGQNPYYSEQGHKSH